MSNTESIFLRAGEMRRKTNSFQAVAIQMELNRAYEAGETFKRFEYAMLPEIGQELAGRGYDVVVTLSRDGTGCTIVSWTLSKEGRKGRLIVFGPQLMADEYKSQMAEYSNNQELAQDQNDGEIQIRPVED